MPSFKFLDNLGNTWENARESVRDDLLQFAIALNQLLTPAALLDGTSNTDTLATTPSKGALIVGSNADPSKWTKLAIGATADQVLTTNGTTPSWGHVNVGSSDAVSGVLATFNGGTSVDIASQALPLGGGQIQFPATQNPSAGANVLDDYEEGTWAGTDASGAGLTFTGVVGRYIKIGRTVVLTGFLVYPATGSGAAAKIGNFPFSTTAFRIDGYVREGSANLEIFTTSGAAVTNTQMSGNSIAITVTYLASA